MLNPAVTDGVDLFVNILIFLVAFVFALLAVDIKKTREKNEI